MSAVTEGLRSPEDNRGPDASRSAASRRSARVVLRRLRPRWNKALSDLWGNKIRSLLVIASVAVGLFAVGMITTTHAIIARDMRGGYAGRNPANIVAAVSGVDDDLLELVRGVEGVTQAEGVRLFDLQVLDGQARWVRVSLKASPDLEGMSINRVKLVEGTWPPGDREIVVERNKRGELPAAIGQMVTVRLPSGRERRLKLVGVVSDLTLGASSNGGFFLSPPQGYITFDTLTWLEQPEHYNTVFVTSTQGEDMAYLRDVSNRVSDEVESGGGLVYNATLRGTRDHPNASYSDAMAGVLFMLGGLVVFLSAFLITNTLQALRHHYGYGI